MSLLGQRYGSFWDGDALGQPSSGLFEDINEDMLDQAADEFPLICDNYDRSAVDLEVRQMHLMCNGGYALPTLAHRRVWRCQVSESHERTAALVVLLSSVSSF